MTAAEYPEFWSTSDRSEWEWTTAIAPFTYGWMWSRLWAGWWQHLETSRVDVHQMLVRAWLGDSLQIAPVLVVAGRAGGIPDGVSPPCAPVLAFGDPGPCRIACALQERRVNPLLSMDVVAGSGGNRSRLFIPTDLPPPTSRSSRRPRVEDAVWLSDPVERRRAVRLVEQASRATRWSTRVTVTPVCGCVTVSRERHTVLLAAAGDLEEAYRWASLHGREAEAPQVWVCAPTTPIDDRALVRSPAASVPGCCPV